MTGRLSGNAFAWVALLAGWPLAAVAQPAEAVPFGDSPVADDEVTWHATLDQFEGRLGDPSSFRWDGEAWAGTDTDRVWLKSEGRVGANGDGRVSDGDQELLYDRPVTTFFDAQVGVRVDLDDGPTREWAAFGVEGVAPYGIAIAPTLYVGGNGGVAFRLAAETDLLITNRWILQPQVELNAYSREDRPRGVGAGLSDLDAGLRLRYELSRRVAPYLGVAYFRETGGAVGIARETGDRVDEMRLLAGIRFRF